MNTSGERSAQQWLADIVAWGERIAKYLDGKSEADFANDTLVQDAVLRCIECIGEASRQIMKHGYAEQFPEMKFVQAYWTRNRIAHGYYDISIERIWVTATEAVPEFVLNARRAIDESRL